jgi:3,4-dihydroxyphenylacetate 2,3-dioxygenase
MGELVFAAKVTHVPTMIMSGQEGPLKGCRQQAIDGHREIGRRMRAAGVDTVVVADVHWLVNSGYHINAKAHFKGVYASNEFPQFIDHLEYDIPGNPELGNLIAKIATAKGSYTLSHQVEALHLEYGTLVPMHFMNPDGDLKVVSVAGWCTSHSQQSSRWVGEAIREAAEASDSKVALLASGSLSHKMWPTEIYAENDGTFNISKEFNRQVDLMVLEMWKRGDIATFLKILPEYAQHCDGEGLMHDTVMLFAALGWDKYKGKGEVIGEYFPSSGTGQVNVVFEVL